jgi:hypothetical protein
MSAADALNDSYDWNPAVPSEPVTLHSLWKLQLALDRLEASLLA